MTQTLESIEQYITKSYPHTENYLELGNDKRMHYVDEGRGEPLLMVHGDPSWGFLYRKFIGPLSETNRCIVPDHIGMGKSSKPPQDTEYSLARHINHLETLILELDLFNINLVVHDWGGPIGLGVAVRHPERIKSLVITNTWAGMKFGDYELPLIMRIIRSKKGEHYVVKKNKYTRDAFKGGVYNQANVTEELLQAYEFPFQEPESRRAILNFTRDLPLADSDYSGMQMKFLEQGLDRLKDKPALVLWGTKDPVLPEPFLNFWKQRFPGALVREYENASHFLQEDVPEEMTAEIQAFLKD